MDDKCERQSCNRLLRRLLQGFGRRNTLFGRLLGFERGLWKSNILNVYSYLKTGRRPKTPEKLS